MFKGQKKPSSLILFLLFILLGMETGRSYGEEILTFGPRETKIIGSIPYTVIGQYKAQFHVFKGRIGLDERTLQVQSVYLEIEVKSIKSNCPWCDKIARSRRLLYAARYPKIIFKSDTITQDQSGYQVKGVLAMHGVKRRMTFPFKAGIFYDQKMKRKTLDLKGIWNINRKHFNIVWNKLLDRGGVLVGDDFTVNWGIKEYVNR